MRLWWLFDADYFWQVLVAVPALQRAAGYMPRELQVDEVQPIADGLIQHGLLAAWDPADLWLLVCRLDNSVGDRDRILEVFSSLALQEPYHPALDCLGAMLLHMASNPRRHLSYPRGEYADSDINMGVAVIFWLPGMWNHHDLERAGAGLIPELTCRMAAADVIDWVTRLQLVLPPPQAHRLLLQLLQGPNSRTLFKAKGVLRLYDLLLQQLARPGWEAQQQAAMLPPAAADVVLGSLRDASKSRAAATRVLVLSLCGTVP
jgi:hypothetical protein